MTDPALITADMSVREAVARYPGIAVIFDQHGMMGCGGPDGPLEPIGFFARVHNVDPAAFLAELNACAARPRAAAQAEEPPAQQRSPYFIAVIASVMLAVLGGFPLGILIALANAGRDVGVGVKVLPLTQVHGHLQIAGWAGLFIVGIAYHVIPRFKAVPLRYPALTLPSIALIFAGVVLRAATQPWADSDVLAALMVASAVLELAGAAAFAAIVLATLKAAQREPYDAFLAAAVIWFVAASVANLVLVRELAADSGTMLATSKDAPLLQMYLFGFMALFILGVSIRVLPAFLSLRPTSYAPLPVALALYTGGLALRVATGWADAYDESWATPEWLEAVSVYLVAGGVSVFVLALNIYLPAAPGEAEDTERAYGKLIRAAYVWLAVAFGIEVWFATRAVLGDFTPNGLEAGAARHALAIGFMTQMIFGVGVRALPVFAGKRLYSQRLVDVSFVLINLAALERVGNALVDVGSVRFRWDQVSISGALALAAVIVFTYNIMRSVRGAAAIAPVQQEAKEMQQPAGKEEGFVITPSTVIADILKSVPGSLDLLVSLGFTPLLDPVMREKMAPTVTVAMAAQIHNLDVQELVATLNALAAGDVPPAAEAGPVTAERLMDALRACFDPEIPVNIVDLGLVYNVNVQGNRASIIMTMTAPDCPMGPQLVADVERTALRLGLEEVNVELVREPPWDPSRMSPAAREALGWQ